jgi:hypothetical protein
MKATITEDQHTSVARTVHPEDLKCGDYVAVLNDIEEFPSFLWGCDVDSSSREQPVRMRFRSSGDGTPMRIKSICLPFVLVVSPRSQSLIFDVRQVELVRLPKRYAKAAWKHLKKKTKNGR